MKSKQLFDAINQTAEDLGIHHWIETNHIIHCHMAMNQLASVMWTNQFPENPNTVLIREQFKNLYYKGRLVFDDV